jgi:hypothetical protein
VSIHVYKEDDGTFQVWTDCEEHSSKDGRCLEAGNDEHEALLAARHELELDLEEIDTRLFALKPIDTQRPS